VINNLLLLLLLSQLRWGVESALILLLDWQDERVALAGKSSRVENET
jgi:hypothetical protein